MQVLDGGVVEKNHRNHKKGVEKGWNRPQRKNVSWVCILYCTRERNGRYNVVYLQQRQAVPIGHRALIVTFPIVSAYL